MYGIDQKVVAVLSMVAPNTVAPLFLLEAVVFP